MCTPYCWLFHFNCCLHHRSCRESNDWSNDSDCIQLLHGSVHEAIPESVPHQKPKPRSYGASNNPTNFRKSDPFSRKTGNASKSHPIGIVSGTSGAKVSSPPLLS